MKPFFYILFLTLLLSNVHSQSKMFIHLQDGTTDTIEISDIKKITFSEITNIDDARTTENILKSFRLFQNYPNPFNPTTTIEYHVPDKGFVEVKIFDATGRLVKTLLSKEQDSGTYKLNWQGNNENHQRVSSGMYIIQVKFENNLLSRKMLLIK